MIQWLKISLHNSYSNSSNNFSQFLRKLSSFNQYKTCMACSFYSYIWMNPNVSSARKANSELQGRSRVSLLPCLYLNFNIHVPNYNIFYYNMICQLACLPTIKGLHQSRGIKKKKQKTNKHTQKKQKLAHWRCSIIFR